MDIEKLDREVDQILAREKYSANYERIRGELREKGYNQQELGYMMGLIDERLLSNLQKGGQNRVARRNMVLGGILSLVGLLVILSAYFGKPAVKEVYYVALVIFALGYLVFRNGFRRRQ
jgi:hypothetical protein